MAWKKRPVEHFNPFPEAYSVTPRRGPPPPPPPTTPPSDRLYKLIDGPLDEIFGGSMLAWVNKSPDQVVAIIEIIAEIDGRKAIPWLLVDHWQTENEHSLATHFAVSRLADKHFAPYNWTNYVPDPFGYRPDDDLDD